MNERPLKVGLLLPHWTGAMGGATPRWRDILAFAQRAEAVGFDSLWTVDHLVVRLAAVLRQFGSPVPAALEDAPPHGYWECWSLLAALAATTPRVELGSLVTCAGYRNPALLAKMAATVDEVSGGRLILGLGAGDFESEHHAFGYRWNRRIGRFEEALAIIAPLLREGRVDFEGAHYRVRECELRPRGPRPHGPPILIGALGAGPRMLELTARYADLWQGWLAYGRSAPDRIPPLRTVVDAACVAAGRDPATLGRTAAVGVVVLGEPPVEGAEPLTGSPEELAEAFRGFAREGVSHLQIELRPKALAGIEALAPVLELLDRG